MKINIADDLTKRLGKLESNFKHYMDDMAYLTLVSGIDKTLKDLVAIQVLRQAQSETVAREMSRLDLAVLDQNELTDIVKLRPVYLHDFESNSNDSEGEAVSVIQRDFKDHLNKIKNPPKSWGYNVSDQTKLHYAAVYIDVQANEDFELPETKRAFLKQYPELKDANAVHKSIQNHQQERDHSVEEIVEAPLQTHVIEPTLTEHTDLQARQSDITTLYKGQYKEFQVTAFLQVLELGNHLDEEEETETTLTTDEQGEVVAIDEVAEALTEVKEEPAPKKDKTSSEASSQDEQSEADESKVEAKDKAKSEDKDKKDKKEKKDKKGKKDKKDKDKKSKKKDKKKADKKEDSKDKKKKDKKKKDKKKNKKK